MGHTCVIDQAHHEIVTAYEISTDFTEHLQL